MPSDSLPQVIGPVTPGFRRVLTPEALAFIANLHRHFNPTRRALLQARDERHAAILHGELPDFLPETAAIRQDESWQVAPPPADIEARLVEIIGPADRKHMIDALNSGASALVADLEDMLSPTWDNVMQGQLNLMDAVRRTLEYIKPDGTRDRLNDEIALLLVRPRGWHLTEKHVLVDGEAMSASLFDFGLFLFHNVVKLEAQGSGPYFYLPKLESHLDARLWNDVFTAAEDTLGLTRGTIRATALIETILAAFEMDEILYELREHSLGLSAGRWDYIFSAIKTFRETMDGVFPDRAAITMNAPFARAYTQLIVKTCHRRGAHAIGGMASLIPNQSDPRLTRVALSKVNQDKMREARDGFDGTWVVHPDMAPMAKAVFEDALGIRPHQIDRRRDDFHATRADLLDFCIPDGKVTEAGVRHNIGVSLRYLAAWLGSQGAEEIFDLLEDTSTAEIARSLLWQWLHRSATLDDGRTVTADLYVQIRDEEAAKIDAYPARNVELAVQLLDELVLSDRFVDFLTDLAYDALA